MADNSCCVRGGTDERVKDQMRRCVMKGGEWMTRERTDGNKWRLKEEGDSEEEEEAESREDKGRQMRGER